MSKDYYQDLEINRDASQSEIAKAYRKLSLRWHPKLCSQPGETQSYHFCKISEAYEVLSDSVRRAFYDKYGEEKLKEGLFAEGELKGGYKFKNNPEEIFNRFYGENNAFAQIFDGEGEEELGSLFGKQFGGQGYKGNEKIKNLDVSVPVTLEEISNGCVKVVKYPRTILNNDGRTTSNIVQEKQIEIQKGVKNGQVIKYPGEGNQAPQVKNSDLIFTIEELEHSQFKRKNNDLIYVEKITLIDALNAPPVTLRTLDGRTISVPMDTLINPQSIKQVKGEGLPIFDDDKQQRGDLYIKFDIEFPKAIPEDKKQRIRELLS